MNKFLILRIAHFIYLGLLLTLILFYFEVYQPYKLHNICAESSAKTVLNESSNPNSYEYYHALYNACVSEKSITLLTLFKTN